MASKREGSFFKKYPGYSFNSNQKVQRKKKKDITDSRDFYQKSPKSLSIQSNRKPIWCHILEAKTS